MRIRYKKWARPELEASKFYEDNPEEWKGRWKEHYSNNNDKFMIELGCGKGQFMAGLALDNLNVNYLAIDLVDAMLGLAKRNIEDSYNEREIEPNNVMITRFDIDFCNPWPRGKHRKKRLTHTKQLLKYKEFLKEGAEVYFKTDDDELFDSSLFYFEEAGFEVLSKTYDLHSENIFGNNIETEHEKMFSEQGIKIKALIAKLKQ